MTTWQEALFTPRRVAVIGASASQGKAGALFLCNLISAEAGFGGEVIAIHPTASEILGCPAYPSVSAVPEPVDLEPASKGYCTRAGCMIHRFEGN